MSKYFTVYCLRDAFLMLWKKCPALRNGPLRHGRIVPTGNRVRLDGSALVRRLASLRGSGRGQISSARGLDRGFSAMGMTQVLFFLFHSLSSSSYSTFFIVSLFFLFVFFLSLLLRLHVLPLSPLDSSSPLSSFSSLTSAQVTRFTHG